jgi:hypothetical protein
MKDFEMNMSKNIGRVILLSVISLLSLSLVCLAFNSIRLSKQLDQERIEKETLLSEKIHLSRSLEALQKEVNSITDKNLELSRLFEATSLKSKKNKKY